MKNIKLYKKDSDYQSNKVTLPKVHVACSEDTGNVFFGGIKKVVDYITEEEYGSAVFNVFKSAGWIPESATKMGVNVAKKITSIGTLFHNNTEITDATFLRYFTGLSSLSSSSGFVGCISLVRAAIPVNVTGSTTSDTDVFNNCNKLEYVEICEGVTELARGFLKSSGIAEGVIVKYPSTLTMLPTNFCQRARGVNNTIDLRNTSIVTIGNDVFKDGLEVTHAYFPSTLTSVGEDLFYTASNLQYIEFNSDTSLNLGGYSLGRNGSGEVSCVVNFKNDIPITMGNNMGYAINAKCYIIFHSTTAPVIGSNFYFTSRNSTEIYVPSEAIETYKAISNLSSFVNRIYAIGGEEWAAAGLSQYE